MTAPASSHRAARRTPLGRPLAGAALLIALGAFYTQADHWLLPLLGVVNIALGGAIASMALSFRAMSTRLIDPVGTPDAGGDVEASEREPLMRRANQASDDYGPLLIAATVAFGAINVVVGVLSLVLAAGR